MPISNSLPLVIIAARHGATYEPGAIAGFNGPHDDPPLTAAGRAQADTLAAALTEILQTWRVGEWALHHSPRVRTQQTLGPLAAALSLPMQQSAVLDELNYGRWAAKPKAELAQHEAGALWDWDHHGLEPRDAGFAPPAHEADDETRAWVDARARDQRPLVLVSHSGRLRSVYALVRDANGRRAKMGVGRVGILWRQRTDAPWERWTWDATPAQALTCWHQRLRTMHAP